MTVVDTLKKLALAGLDRPRPMKLGAVWAPSVESTEGNLMVYSHTGPERKQHRSSGGLFRQLIEAKTVDAVLRFCKRWGVLGLCGHGLPAAHGCVLQPIKTEILYGSPRRYYGESAESVLRFARGIESLFRIGIEMAQDRPGDPSDWKNAEDVIASPDFGVWDDDPAGCGLMIARARLMNLMRRLIEICRIRPRFFWNRQTGSWQIDLDSEGLSNNIPALIVIELMITIADKDGFAICSSCHKSYIPDRRRDPTRRNYCPQCGIKAAWRDAARAKRERDRKETR